ncbi:transposase [Mesorhizobium sp. M0830]
MAASPGLGIKDGLMILTHAQFEHMFAGLDWRRVHAIKTRTPDIDADA